MIKKGENMIIFSNKLEDRYKAYLNKSAKLSRDVKNGKLFRIKNGLY